MWHLFSGHGVCTSYMGASVNTDLHVCLQRSMAHIILWCTTEQRQTSAQSAITVTARRNTHTDNIAMLLQFFDHPSSGMVYNFGRVCLSIRLSLCLSVDNFRKPLCGKFIFAHPVYISREYGSNSYVKVIVSKSRSQKQKKHKKIPISSRIVERRYTLQCNAIQYSTVQYSTIHG